VNDDEPGLIEDFDEFLEKTAPYDLKKYRHHRTGEAPPPVWPAFAGRFAKGES
jgi:thiamine phosphate synthase YjbQ (UPF0047 family)